jgi:hypothetical protein
LVQQDIDGMTRLTGILTSLQIQQKMTEVTREAERRAERIAERARVQQERIDDRAEDALFFTGKCHVCGRPVGPRTIFCGRRCRLKSDPTWVPRTRGD